jgi:hypothetical protein
MARDELKMLQDAIYGNRAGRMLQILERSRRSGQQVEPADTPLFMWLIEELTASRRGAASVAKAMGRDTIAADGEEIKTSFSKENEMYYFFQDYSRAQTPEEHAEWVDAAVGALDGFAAGGWNALNEQQRQTIASKVEPMLRRIREIPDRQGVDCDPFGLI